MEYALQHCYISNIFIWAEIMGQPISNGDPRQVYDGVNNKPVITENALQETAEIRQSRQSLTVDFEENDPRNPLNWPGSKKWTITLVVSLSVFLMPLSSSIVAPELSTIKDELHMGSSLEAVLVLSTFVLTYCLGPLILGPLSEIFGRATVLHSGNSFYLIFNLVCGFARNKGELLASRLLSGIGGAGGLVVSLTLLLRLGHALMHQT